MTVNRGRAGRMLAAIFVVGLYWVFGAGLLILLFFQFANTLSFFWLDLFRPAYYLPGLFSVVYLYAFRKEKSLFLESVAFLLTLSLTIFFTLEIIIYI
jgi:hypothetical protein